MPPAGTTRGLDPGLIAEVRAAQVWFWDGSYVRRGVDLQHKFGSDASTVTDIDVLAYTLDPALRVRKLVGEVKSGRSASTPRPLDRALWVCGLRGLVGADSGEITTAFHPSAVVRDLCRSMGITVQHLDDLAEREKRLRIPDVDDHGSQGETVARIRAEVHALVRQEPALERAYWFLVSEVWFLDPYDALKRLLGLIREISKNWPPDAHADAMKMARWLFAESISIATLNLAIIAGESNTMSSGAFREAAVSRLASGDLPFHALKALSERVDEYVGKLLTSADAPPEVRVSAMGALLPTPPDYTEPLLELLTRLAATPSSTARLPRQVDTVVFERLVRRRQVPPIIGQRLQLTQSTDRLFRLIAAFLRGQLGIPAAVDKALTTSLTGADETEQQATLFVTDQVLR